MQKKEIITNPFTIHLRSIGMTLTGWANVNNFPPGMTSQVVNAGIYQPLIIKELREQEKYSLLPKLVRDKIEAKELQLKEKEEALNG